MKNNGCMRDRLTIPARSLLSLAVLASLVFLHSPLLYANGFIHHEIQVVFQPEAQRLEVVDQIILPASLRPGPDGRFHFLLHDGLEPQSETPGVMITREAETPGAEGEGAEIPVAHYVLSLPVGLRVFVVRYQGEIHHPSALSESDGDAHPVDETPGFISSDGIFLSGKTLWLPWFYTDLVSFSMQVTLPAGWHAVSQGEQKHDRIQDDRVEVRWESPEPQEEVFLVAGRWTEYRRDAGRVTAQVFLQSPDRDLAAKYLEATEQYIEMYQDLIGPYPYKKFALVEHFWEDIRGIPSMTLVGPKTLRFPFILHTSYPHELLHNWWGNGVFVDREMGNWGEGLTRYLAEWLIQEQNGMGLESRRAALQAYADFASANAELPLAEFQTRNDVGAQALGFGKGAFLFHMLRRELGDGIFVQALRTFFHDYRFKRASFDDLIRSFNRASGKDLSQVFSQWVFSSGAPILRARRVRSQQTDSGYRLSASIYQEQMGPPYVLNIPVSVTLHSGEAEALQKTFTMVDKEMDIEWTLPSRPIHMKIDPEIDLFRKLHPAEMPPSLSKVLGAAGVVMILPSNASEALGLAYQQLAETWQRAQPERIEILWDKQLEAIPKDRDIWLFGWKNRFQGTILNQLQSYGLSMNSAITRIGDVQIPRRHHTLVLSARNPQSVQHTLNWLATDQVAALGPLAGKLPHYGDYGYLGFEGEELKNVVKGRWPVIASPMTVRVTQGDGKWIKAKETVLPPREPLARLPPIFSEDRLRRDIDFLSSQKMKGRGFGTPPLDRAAEYIAAAFHSAGLAPGGDSERSYLQQWKGEAGGVGSGVVLKNVIAVLPAQRLEGMAVPVGGDQESIVVGAHYDHLGFGWPHVQKGDEGQLHPGANDNASGVALLLELARHFGDMRGLKRTIVFVAFTGKEVELRGSAHFVAEGKPFSTNKIIGMINLDTVGNLSRRPLIVLGSGSAREWPPLLREAGVATGVSVSPVPGTIGASDQLSFIKYGIPAIQLFSGMNSDTGRPTDTLEKIDLEGVVKAGRIAKEMIIALADRTLGLTFTPIESNVPALMWQRRSQVR